MKKLWLFLLLTVLGVSALFATDVTVTRPRTYLRNGPGAYFDLISELPVNTKLAVISEDDGWYQVSYKGQTGYVAANAIGARPRSDKSLDRLVGGSAEISASRHGMSAGAKGFGERMTKAGKGNPVDYETMQNYTLGTDTYKKFRSETKHKYDLDSEKKIKIPSYDVPAYFSYSEEVVGYALAASVARAGFVNDKALLNYVNCVGQWVVENSDAYDQNFKFFILDIPQPNAYAFPGGVVFITRGMLETVQNEAELACVLGHEIAHITHYHGMIEVEKRINQIKADAAFDELDQEVQWDDQTEATAAEMDSLAFSTFEYLIQGRLDQYEREADQVGMIYAARAGYDPKALPSLLNRMLGNQSNNDHYRPEIIAKRLGWAKEDLQSMKMVKDKQLVAERLYQRTKG